MKYHLVETSSKMRANIWPIPKSGYRLLQLAELNFQGKPNDWKYENVEGIDNDYISFTITRHPFKRCQSAYRYFFQHMDENGSCLRWGVQCFSFEDFVKKVIMPSMPIDGTDKIDPHIRSQTSLIAPEGKILVHKYCDLESVNECGWLKEVFNRDYFPVTNANPKSREKFDEWTDELKELVYIRYMQDFYLLGYEP